MVAPLGGGEEPACLYIVTPPMPLPPSNDGLQSKTAGGGGRRRPMSRRCGSVTVGALLEKTIT